MINSNYHKFNFILIYDHAQLAFLNRLILIKGIIRSNWLVGRPVWCDYLRFFSIRTKLISPIRLIVVRLPGCRLKSGTSEQPCESQIVIEVIEDAFTQHKSRSVTYRRPIYFYISSCIKEDLE